MTPERLAEIKKIRNCVPFIDNGAGVPETQAAIDDLLADNTALREELAEAERRRGGECDTCGGWVCPPLRCAACMMTKRITPDSDTGPLAADVIRQQDKELAALREAVRGALSDVKAERAKQDAKWGEQNHDDATWSLILGEEVGESCEAALHDRFGGKKAGTLRAELVQVAAVAVAWIECLDRRNANPLAAAAVREAKEQA